MKKHKVIKGYIRQDCIGNYITNGKSAFEDGKKIFRLNTDLNGYKVALILLKRYKRSA